MKSSLLIIILSMVMMSCTQNIDVTQQTTVPVPVTETINSFNTDNVYTTDGLFIVERYGDYVYCFKVKDNIAKLHYHIPLDNDVVPGIVIGVSISFLLVLFARIIASKSVKDLEKLRK